MKARSHQIPISFADFANYLVYHGRFKSNAIGNPIFTAWAPATFTRRYMLIESEKPWYSRRHRQRVDRVIRQQDPVAAVSDMFRSLRNQSAGSIHGRNGTVGVDTVGRHKLSGTLPNTQDEQTFRMTVSAVRLPIFFRVVET
jgi:hypothetical protein